MKNKLLLTSIALHCIAMYCIALLSGCTSPSFKVGDCIISNERGYWETDFISIVKFIETEAKLYGVSFLDSSYTVSHSFKSLESGARKVACPKEIK